MDFLKLLDVCSICTAETLAIARAVDLIDEMDIPKAVIFSHSLSVLHRISSVEARRDDHITLLVKRNLMTLNATQARVILAWISSHTIIFGNKMADQLANEGRSSSRVMKVKLEYKDFFSVIRNMT